MSGLFVGFIVFLFVLAIAGLWELVLRRKVAKREEELCVSPTFTSHDFGPRGKVERIAAVIPHQGGWSTIPSKEHEIIAKNGASKMKPLVFPNRDASPRKRPVFVEEKQHSQSVKAYTHDSIYYHDDIDIVNAAIFAATVDNVMHNHNAGNNSFFDGGAMTGDYSQPEVKEVYVPDPEPEKYEAPDTDSYSSSDE